MTRFFNRLLLRNRRPITLLGRGEVEAEEGGLFMQGDIARADVARAQEVEAEEGGLFMQGLEEVVTVFTVKVHGPADWPGAR
jgi:hypothetical protein